MRDVAERESTDVPRTAVLDLECVVEHIAVDSFAEWTFENIHLFWDYHELIFRIGTSQGLFGLICKQSSVQLPLQTKLYVTQYLSALLNTFLAIRSWAHRSFRASSGTGCTRLHWFSSQVIARQFLLKDFRRELRSTFRHGYRPEFVARDVHWILDSSLHKAPGSFSCELRITMVSKGRYSGQSCRKIMT